MKHRITFLALLAILLGTLSAVGKDTDAYRKIIMEPTEVLTQFLDEALMDTQYAEKLDSVIIMMTSKVDDDGVSRYQFVFIQRGPQNIDDAIMKTTIYVRYRNFDIPIAFNIDDNGLDQNMLQDKTWSQELQTFMCPKRLIIRDVCNYNIIKQSLFFEKRW